MKAEENKEKEERKKKKKSKKKKTQKQRKLLEHLSLKATTTTPSFPVIDNLNFPLGGAS